MYSVKTNVLLVAASLKAYGIKHVVLSPGSRNAPLLHTFAVDDFFHCHSIVDERCAGYYALGLMLKLQEPVAVCCTSGTALLNYGPALAEAFYQELPLVIISADRSLAWIGQMDGQTIPQNNTFASITKKSVQLPEPQTSEEVWFCQRLIHEALLACQFQVPGPVHINVPISEPLFDFSAPSLPEVVPVEMQQPLTHLPEIGQIWQQFDKRMIVVGQMPSGHGLAHYLQAVGQGSIILAEHLANLPANSCFGKFDQILPTLSQEERQKLAPELLVTFGGHVVSKHLKHFLRQNKPKAHWHICASGNVIDLFQSLTRIICTTPQNFMEELTTQLSVNAQKSAYVRQWEAVAEEKTVLPGSVELHDALAVGALLKKLPKGSALHLANSSSVRNAQRFDLPDGIDVLCNRGTNGIEGAVSTAIGYAALHKGLTFLTVGDLSFFYDLNALSLEHLNPRLRIFLINNGGGGIFYTLPGTDKSPALSSYIAAGHKNSGQPWAKAAGFRYLHADNVKDLQEQLPEFVQPGGNTPMLFEISIPRLDPKMTL